MRGFYQNYFGISHAKHFETALQQYTTIIEARVASSKGEENEVAAMVFIFNSTDSKIIKAWLLAAIWEMDGGNLTEANQPTTPLILK